MSENTAGYELGWDDQIESDGPEYILLPEGDYDFEVTNFERGRYTPTEKAKLPPCNMAVLSLKIDAPEGTSTIQHKLYLHSTTEGLLCAFFTCIGQRKHGERITMNWNKVVGSRGRAKIGVRTYTSKGEERAINEVKKFYDPDESASSAAPAAQASGYTPGKF